MSDRDSVKALITRIEMGACPGFGDLSSQCCASLDALKAMLARDEQAALAQGGDAVPSGWKLTRESGDRITLDADGIGFYVARMNSSRISEIMLYALANDLLLGQDKP